MRLRHLLPVLAGLVLSACQPGTNTRPGPGMHPAVLHGQASYRERMATPPDSRLDVRLLDISDAGNTVVAEKSFNAGNAPPFDFALPYNPDRVQQSGHYALSAKLLDAHGNLLFASKEDVPVTPGSDTVNQVLMRRASGGVGSAWAQARERGVGFRAIGNEPSWSVEVDKGATPALRASLNNGNGKIHVARTQPYADQSKGIIGFRGSSEKGQTVDLHIQRGRCTDSMSGARFTATATLKVGHQTYAGCGRFLLGNPGSTQP